ncbi:hypothetical protein [Thalassomonas haliotis]|uniref:Uncharacterized protein n=1 Tax=Thalassomonas haliotis TaxID=485448 RepID=A0ABY7VA88_9GAMM|nr:hypothetical protein [Thalassomonas haliotis]WDE09984.1 hypothetical protein H3N35_16960 [Thalassomonas haliotis]
MAKDNDMPEFNAVKVFLTKLLTSLFTKKRPPSPYPPLTQAGYLHPVTLLQEQVS